MPLSYLRSWRVQTLLVCCFITLVLAGGCNLTEPISSAPSPTDTTAVDTDAAPPPPPVQVATETADATNKFEALPRLEGKATVRMVIDVNGEEKPIEMELDGDRAPITAGNFVDLVQRGFYDGLAFHRVVRSPEPFVVQGGDPQSLDPNFPMERLGTGGFTDPDTGSERFIPLEILPADESAQLLYSTPFPQAGIQAKPALNHQRGAVAMARSQFPDSASSQFYIALSDLDFLDGNYAVFGYVPSQDMPVVDEIQQGDRIVSAEVTDGLENLKAPQS